MTKTQTDQEILAVVNEVIRLKRSTLGPNLINELQNSLTRPNPAYNIMHGMVERNPRMRFAKMPPATVSSIIMTDDTVYVPRGFKKELGRIVSECGQTIKYIDEMVSSVRNQDLNMRDDVKLRSYQRAGLSALLLAGSGILEMPCGGGKTITAIAALCALAQKTLVVVHTIDLLEQWIKALHEKTTIRSVGQYGGNVKRDGDVVIATIQTLARLSTHSFDEFVSEFGCVILDECHHCPATTFMGVINRIPARYRYGLTATTRRKDGLEFLMTDTIGPIVAKVFDSDLEDTGVSQQCSVKFIQTSAYSEYTADSWTKLLKDIVENESRNRAIVRYVVDDWNNGHQILVLSDRVEHCRELNRMLSAQGMRSEILLGEVSPQIRKKTIEQLKKKLVDVVVATSVADEGLDVPELSSIHLTCPSANAGRLKQRTGRIRRPLPGKVSVIRDYVDLRISACLKMFQARRRLYRSWGFVFEEDGNA